MGKAETKYLNTAMKMDDAFLALIAERPFGDLTITDVCRKACVHRSTFYAHYDRMLDILIEVGDKTLNGFFDARFSGERVSLEVFLHSCLLLIEDNPALFRALFGNASNYCASSVFRIIDARVTPDSFAIPTGKPLDTKYPLMFMASGISAVLSTWVLGGFEMEREEVARLIMSCVSGVDHEGDA